jgi:hypothetical protein
MSMPTLALQKIRKIDQKIINLRHTQEKFQQQIELKIISLLKTEKAFATDFEILYGAIYELTQKLKNDSFHHIDTNHHSAPEIANWRQLGISRLQKSKGKNTNSKTNSATSVSRKIAVPKQQVCI